MSLQETHVGDVGLIRDIKSQWGGPIHVTPGTGAGKGLFTLFSPKYQDSETELVYRNERIIISKLVISSEILTIVNVYAPCENPDKINFLKSLASTLDEMVPGLEESHLVLLGDLNISLTPLDIISGSPHSDNIRKSLAELIERFSFVDTFRLLNPDEKTYTWKKSCKKPKLGWCNSARRLDYILLGESLAPYALKCHIANPGFSDHRAVVLELQFSSFKYGKGMFKLNTSLLHDNNYYNIIIKEINDTILTYKGLNPHLIWEMVKINVKETSQAYSKFKARESKLLRSNLHSALLELERDFALNPDNVSISNKIDQIKTKLEIEEIHLAKGAQVRSRTKYVEEGEKNTRYFLNLEKFRSCTNTITRLTCDTVSTCNEDKILNEIKSKFKKRYNTNNKTYSQVSDLLNKYTDKVKLPKINEEDSALCEAELSELEVARAVRSLNNDSSPGSDGLPAEFYKAFWQHIKVPLIASFKYSFHIQSLPPSERLGVITLLHKGKDLTADCLDNWRPLSLCNVDYRALAKLLSLRLDKVIDKIVGEQQVGFMKGRDISLLHRRIDDVIEHQKSIGGNGLIAAIDFKQAFDSINIECVLKSLELFGFGENFIRWIGTLNKERLACVKNGGHVSEPFQMANGVRQGCPISPQLFLLPVEILAQKIIQDPKICGLNPASARFILKILQYCDDTSLFCRSNDDLNIALSHFQAFSVLSGLHINIKKTYGLYLGREIKEMEEISIQIKEKVKILGITYCKDMSPRDLAENWQPKINLVLRILTLWSRRQMSLIGRLHIIKVYGMSQFIYIMKSIGIPYEVLKEINSIFFGFLWKGTANRDRVTEKVKREVMYNHFWLGGLKVFDMIAFQDSIYLDWAEKLLTIESKPSDWKYQSVIFFQKIGGLSVFRSRLSVKSKKVNPVKTDSSFWTLVLSCWLKYAENLLQPISVYDPISNNNALTLKKKTLSKLMCWKYGLMLIKDVVIDGRVMPFRLFQETCKNNPRCMLEYHAISSALMKLNVADLSTDSAFYFQNVEVGQIGRKAFYKLIKKPGTPSCYDSWFRKYGVVINKDDWESVHGVKEGKLISLCWKIVHRIYPTNVLLYHMNLKQTQLCTHCDLNEPDFLDHFFFSCKLISVIWSVIQREIEQYMNLKVILSGKIVLLGAHYIQGITRSQRNQINKVIAVGKMAVSKYKFKKEKTIEDIYLSEADLRSLWGNFSI